MKKLLVTIVLSVGMIIQPIFSQVPSGMDSISSVYKKSVKSVVNISVRSRSAQDPFYGNMREIAPFHFFFQGALPREQIRQGEGSGFIYDPVGLILTNYHVVESADEILVTLSDGRKYSAILKAQDSGVDLAILKIEDSSFRSGFEEEFVSKLGDSDSLEVGEWVVAIGSPFSLDRTVTAGIVSAKGRSLQIDRNTSYNNLIQTDASINPGNSGGPLLDLQGRVVGINTAINPNGQGLGFAIPVNLAKKMVKDIEKYGRVKKSWLGVSIQDVTNENASYLGLSAPKGVLIDRVFENTPAFQAGFLRGDVILSINNQQMESKEVLIEKIQEIPVGQKAKFAIIRGGKSMVLEAVLAEKDAKSNEFENKSESIKVSNLNEKIRQEKKLHSSTRGVLVEFVVESSLWGKMGVLPGDVIVAINQSKIQDLSGFEIIANRIEAEKEIVVSAIRDGSLIWLEYRE